MRSMSTKMPHAVIPPEIEDVGRMAVDAGLQVHAALGAGLLESAYEHCLAYELSRRGLNVRRQVNLPIAYEDTRLDVGYRVDLLVGTAVIVEVKSVDSLAPIHRAQLLTYLKLSNRRLGFLMNFNVRLFKHGLQRMVV
jgi:GxxExxY protein